MYVRFITNPLQMHRLIYPCPRRRYIAPPCGYYGYHGIWGGCYPDYWDHYDDAWPYPYW